jgi:hypothetical protein
MWLADDLSLMTTKAPVWRIQLSHAWIGHSILNVSVDDACEWASRDAWQDLNTKFRNFERKAMWLGEHLGDFSPAVLLDELPMLTSLCDSDKNALRARLNEEFRNMLDVQAVRAGYLAALDSLLVKLNVFRGLVFSPARCEVDHVAQSWRAVQEAALGFKSALEAVPRGVLIP